MIRRALCFAAAVALFSGCAQKQPVLSPSEVSNRECQFVRKKLSGDPDQLVAEYLKRDAAGEFTIVSPWFDQVSLCPGHETGPEVIYVLQKSRAERAKPQKGRATVQVTYQILGTLEPGDNQTWHFHAKKLRQHRKFSLVHTAYGWRMRDLRLSEGEFLSVNTAAARISDSKEKQALLKWRGTSR